MAAGVAGAWGEACSGEDFLWKRGRLASRRCGEGRARVDSAGGGLRRGVRGGVPMAVVELRVPVATRL